jgi:hypothetical protein
VRANLADSAPPETESVNVVHSSMAWVIGPGAPVDLDQPEGQDCAEPPFGKGPIVFGCATEYRYNYPDGKPGTRVFFVEGEVRWTDVRVNPLGPGRIGIPHESVLYRTSWVRRWHRDSKLCLASWSLQGDVQSNFPCAASEIWHGNPRGGGLVGTDTAYWPWLYRYPCRRTGAWTQCSNQVGDAYRYRGRYPTRLGSA